MKIWEPKPPGTLWATPGLLGKSFGGGMYWVSWGGFHGMNPAFYIEREGCRKWLFSAFLFASEMYLKNINFLRIRHKICIKFTTLKSSRIHQKYPSFVRSKQHVYFLHKIIYRKQIRLRRMIFLLGTVTRVFLYKLLLLLYLYRRPCNIYPWRKIAYSPCRNRPYICRSCLLANNVSILQFGKYQEFISWSY